MLKRAYFLWENLEIGAEIILKSALTYNLVDTFVKRRHKALNLYHELFSGMVTRL